MANYEITRGYHCFLGTLIDEYHGISAETDASKSMGGPPFHSVCEKIRLYDVRKRCSLSMFNLKSENYGERL